MDLGSENKLKYILNDVATTSKVIWIHRDQVKSQATDFGKFGKLPKKTVHKLVLDWYYFTWIKLVQYGYIFIFLRSTGRHTNSFPVKNN
jgi:hypothetical protein